MGLLLANPPQSIASKSPAAAAWDAPDPLRLWHLTSLDAPTVAVTWAWGFAWASHVHLPAWMLLLLGLVVWAIYIGDRLLDARHRGRRSDHELQERHYFHWRNRRILLPLASICAIAALWLVSSHMSRGAIGKDSFVAFAAMAYFSGVHTRRAPSLAERFAKRIVSRELVVGAIFSAGCILPLITIAGARHFGVPIIAALIATGLFFAMLAWLNVHAIGEWESRATSNRVQRAAWILAACGFVLAIGVIPISLRIAALSFAAAASAVLLALLDRSRKRLTPLALRIAADIVLLVPLVFAMARLISL